MSMRPPASRRVRTPAIALALLVIVQSGPGGLWILSWRGKRARYARCRLTPCRRRVSHNTLDAADGAHRLHRHFHSRSGRQDSRRPVTLRHRKEGTQSIVATLTAFTFAGIRRSPKSVFTSAKSQHTRFFGGQFSVSPGGHLSSSGSVTPPSAKVFSIPLHHRDLHPGLDAQAMERFPHLSARRAPSAAPESRPFRASGLAERVSMLRHGWLSSCCLHPCPTTEQGRGVATRFTSVQQHPGHPPTVT